MINVMAIRWESTSLIELDGERHVNQTPRIIRTRERLENIGSGDKEKNGTGTGT
jgi:hypothetical protein